MLYETVLSVLLILTLKVKEEKDDAGIKTRHPDLVKSAVELFEQIWNETESIPLKDFMEKGKH